MEKQHFFPPKWNTGNFFRSRNWNIRYEEYDGVHQNISIKEFRALSTDANNKRMKIWKILDRILLTKENGIFVKQTCQKLYH